MAQIVVRNIEEEIMVGLKELAVRHGTSAEQEVRRLISEAVERDRRLRAFRTKTARRRARLARAGRRFGDSAELIRGDRDR